MYDYSVSGETSKPGKRRLPESLGMALLECSFEIEELFVYVLIPLVCITAVCIAGIALYRLMFDPAIADAPQLSIDPAKWFPES